MLSDYRSFNGFRQYEGVVFSHRIHFLVDTCYQPDRAGIVLHEDKRRVDSLSVRSGDWNDLLVSLPVLSGLRRNRSGRIEI